MSPEYCGKFFRSCLGRAAPPGLVRMVEHFLPLAELPAPRPLEIILDTLADMADGDWVRAELPAHPAPLYLMLGGMGYQWHSHVLGARRVEVYIWHSDGAEPPGLPT